MCSTRCFVGYRPKPRPFPTASSVLDGGQKRTKSHLSELNLFSCPHCSFTVLAPSQVAGKAPLPTS